jgi:predicted Zn-dependent peptidase
MSIRPVIILAALLACAAILAASPTLTTLSNGLQVVLIENHSNPVIASVIVVKTGARNETKELNGATHFLEHLLFNGTQTRDQKQLYDEMDFLGGYNNANTASDHTTFQILMSRDAFRKGLEIQADMLFHSILPPDKFEKEKGIVIEEIGKDQDSESNRADRFSDSVIFRGTPYQWPILGTTESIRSLTREQVYDYYKTYYVPDNMVALIMGDFDTKEMIGTVKEVLGKKPKGKLPKHAPLSLESLAQAKSAPVHVIENGPGSNTHVRIALPGAARKDSDYFAYLMMVNLLSDRLDHELTSDSTLGITEVSASSFTDKDFGLLQVGLTLDPKADVEAALGAFHKTVMQFLDEEPSQDRVAATVTAARAEDIFNAERPHYYGMLKSEDLAQAGPEFILKYQDRLKAVTPAQVGKAAQKYLGPIYPVVAVYQAIPDTTPEAPGMPGMMSGMPKGMPPMGGMPPGGKMPPMGGMPPGMPGPAGGMPPGQMKPPITEIAPVTPRVQLAAIPDPATFAAKKSERTTLNRKLSNGLQVVIDQNPDSKVFAAHLLFKNRSACEMKLGAQAGAVDFIHHLFDWGPAGMGQETFQAELKSYGAQAKFYDMAFIPYDDYYTTPEYSYVRLESLDENFAAVFDLVTRAIRDPAFTDEAVTAVRGQMTSLARKNQTSVQEQGKMLFRKLLYGEVSPLAASIVGTPESIAALTASDLQKFHDIYFSPGNLILTVVTSNDAEAVMKFIENTLANWNGGVTLPDNAAALPDTTPRREEKPGGKDQSYLGMGYAFAVESEADQAPLSILNAIVSDRMQFQLREKEGLAYTLGSSVSFFDNWGVWGATMGTGPQNLQRAEAGIKEEVSKASSETFTDHDVTKARNASLGRSMMRSLSRLNQAYQMGVGLLRGKGADYYENWNHSLSAVNAGEVNRVAGKYLTDKRMTVAIVK